MSPPVRYDQRREKPCLFSFSACSRVFDEPTRAPRPSPTAGVVIAIPTLRAHRTVPSAALTDVNVPSDPPSSSASPHAAAATEGGDGSFVVHRTTPEAGSRSCTPGAEDDGWTTAIPCVTADRI